jgi:FkbM family methyltransferase
MLGAQLKKFVRPKIRQMGREIVTQSYLAALKSQASLDQKAGSLGMMSDDELRKTLEIISPSPSQLNQDFFVLHELNWKKNGYFVEFGATDGRTLNNTWLLEKEFGWNGILAEPSKSWRPGLESAGRSAKLEFDCVWSESNAKLTFEEASWGELSTIKGFLNNDAHERESQKTYQVNTVSLNDLLLRNNAPKVIDYLSIDTEGSEYDILSAVDFDRFTFRCITCEHNFTENRERIYALLTGAGYVRKYEKVSQFDDWYVKEA